MKKLLFLTSITILAIFYSCSDDDNNYESFRNDIVGKWVNHSTVAKEVKTNNEKATKAIEEDLNNMFVDDDSYIEFFSDGKFISYDEGLKDSEGTYIISQNTLSLNYISDEDGETSPSVKFTIEKMDKENLVISQDLTESYKQEIHFLLPDEEGVVVSKVIGESISKKRN